MIIQWFLVKNNNKNKNKINNSNYSHVNGNRMDIFLDIFKTSWARGF